MANKNTILPVDKSLFTQPNHKNVPISNIILFSDGKRLLNKLIAFTRKNSSTGVEEMCKRMGIAQSDINFLLNSEKNQVKKEK